MFKAFYCEYHKNWFRNVCNSCLTDIFYRGFDVTLKSTVEYKSPCYKWDDTWEYINSLKVFK